MRRASPRYVAGALIGAGMRSRSSFLAMSLAKTVKLFRRPATRISVTINVATQGDGRAVRAEADSRHRRRHLAAGEIVPTAVWKVLTDQPHMRRGASLVCCLSLESKSLRIMGATDPGSSHSSANPVTSSDRDTAATARGARFLDDADAAVILGCAPLQHAVRTGADVRR